MRRGNTAVLSVDTVRSPFHMHPVRPMNFNLNEFPRAVFKRQYLGGAEEHGRSHH